MPFMIPVLTLFAALMAADADAKTATATELIEKFSPILILTKDTVGEYGDIKVLKPEPVNIMGATSADNIWFKIDGRLVQLSDETWFDPDDVKSNENTWDPRIKLLENKFAFFNGLEDLTFTATDGSDNMAPGESYTLKDAHFDFSGTGTTEWDAEYGRIGENFPNTNTAYVHVYEREIEQYEDTYGLVVVIQYHYFYPYNDWWNNHEGDWQRIDVVVSSWEPETAQVLGVEYRFHGAWTNYYKDYGNNPGLTSRFVFDPQNNLKLSQGTHPVVYVGAGSHAGFPIGGNILTYDRTAIPEQLTQARRLTESMTHTGLVLSAQADGSHSDLWESYDLVPLPLDIDTTNTNNMGLTPDMSWLGARIRWGTPQVSGPIFSLTDGNESPKRGPYNSETDSWGDLAFFADAATGPQELPYSFSHLNYDYTSYHHWAVIGDETWSGTVNLLGDVVVFPGAMLTIREDTVVNFASNDRHQFKEGNNTLSEIFVYGALISEGTSEDPVALGGTEGKIERWGGLRVLGSGRVNLGNYTAVRNTRPAKPVSAGSRVEFSPVSAALRWEPVNDPVISYQTRISPDGTTWPEWSDWTEEYGEGNTYQYTETDLREVKDYWLSVRAVNKTPFDPGDVYWASDPLEVKVTTLGMEDPGTVVLEPTSPRVGQAVTATLTDEDGYIKGSVWTWEHRLVDGTTWTALTGSEDTAESSVYTPTALDLGKELRARVSYRDGHGTNTDMAESAVSAAVVGNQAPVITGAAAVSYAENAMVDVGRYTASDPDGHSIQWLALAGTDASHFELTGADTDATRTLRFKRAPDFETKNTYSVALKVKDRPNDVPRAEDPNASLTTMLEVQVTVENVEEAGSVSLSGTLPPQVGEQVSAALTDPDGNITGATWQWQRRLPGATMWDDITGAMAAAYSPVAEDVGFELQATVGYTDGHNSGKSAASDVTAVVVGGPGDPRELEPVVGAGQVTLTWQEPSSTGGLPILRYEYQQSDDGGETWPAEGEDTDVDCQAATCSQEFALAPGLYAFGVRAVNEVGFSDWVRTDPIRISALMVASQGSNPELAFAEVVAGQTRSLVVETYTASGVADGTTVGWSLAGADVGVFAISGGVLRFATAPDYEMPTDAGHATDEDGNNVYHVTVQATAGEQTATLAVAVEITNADDPGVVTLSSTQPEVDEPIRATLTDQDGSVEHVRWSWLHFSSEDGPRNGEPTEVASSDELIPNSVLMGLRLQARALYADEFGTHQSAESVQTEPVVGPAECAAKPYGDPLGGRVGVGVGCAVVGGVSGV